MSRKDDALHEFYVCAMEYYIGLHGGETKKGLEKWLVKREVAAERARLAGATAKQIERMEADADEDAAMIIELADSGLKVTVEL